MPDYQDQVDSSHQVADDQVDLVIAILIAAIAELKLQIDRAALSNALLAGDIESALVAINFSRMEDLLYGAGASLESPAFVKVLQDTFSKSAMASVPFLDPKTGKTIIFDSIGDRAIRIMREQGASAITGIVESTKEGIRTALANSMAYNASLEDQIKIVERYIGLTGPQTQALTNFRNQLKMRKLLGLTPPDGRKLDVLDQVIASNHLKNGGLSEKQIDALVDRYYQNLLYKRAKDIAETELLSAMNAGRQEFWEQGLDQGVIEDDQWRKFWVNTLDDKLRATHAAIPQMNPNGVSIRDRFITPFGYVMGPQDRIVDLINCRCIVVLLSV